MPLYEYLCDNCGVRFEHRQGFSDAPLTVCPECEGKVHRVIGTAGVIFKGSGFYVTDNRKSSGRPAATAKSDDAAPKTDSSSSGDSSTVAPAANAETKAEAKTEAKASAPVSE
ncbi:MAG TPA: zinc ribbon domain-containing protein [Aggregatilineales bacterium]|nr:FmdB family transcriptional regulator [Anaerolineales bacterium]HRE49540.1 zinc ribbon domain-containing protein [Aggregatilineales bacterium]